MNQMVQSDQRKSARTFAELAQMPTMRKNFADAMGYATNAPEVDRFTRVMIRAVQEDPKLLEADSASLFLACQRAAQDDLLPDGKQGKLVTYRTKSKGRDGKDVWTEKVQWQPMIGGLRLIAARKGFDIRAEVVCENDEFDYEQGDSPSIHHKQPKLGQPRGEVIGAYAIATSEDGRKFREVMDLASITKVKAASKGGDYGPWVSWFDEMARKTVAKRLFKALPFYDDEKLQGVIKRDDEQYQESPAEHEQPERTQEAYSSPGKPRAYAAVAEASDDPATDEDGDFTENNETTDF